MRTEWAHRLGQEESWRADHVKRHPLPPQRVNKLSREKKKKKEQEGKKSHQLTRKCNTNGSDIFVYLTPWEGYTFFDVKQSLMALVNHSASCNYQAGEPQRGRGASEGQPASPAQSEAVGSPGRIPALPYNGCSPSSLCYSCGEDTCSEITVVETLLRFWCSGAPQQKPNQL